MTTITIEALMSEAPRLHAHALNRLSDHHHAEDLVQETLLTAWRKRDTFDGRSTLRTWLTGIMKFKILDHHRATARVPTSNPAEAPVSADGWGSDPMDRLFDRHGSWKIDPNYGMELLAEAPDSPLPPVRGPRLGAALHGAPARAAAAALFPARGGQHDRARGRRRRRCHRRQCRRAPHPGAASTASLPSASSHHAMTTSSPPPPPRLSYRLMHAVMWPLLTPLRMSCRPSACACTVSSVASAARCQNSLKSCTISSAAAGIIQSRKTAGQSCHLKHALPSARHFRTKHISRMAHDLVRSTSDHTLKIPPGTKRLVHAGRTRERNR
jgi:RNA polymerase sigma factor (sigma-70 family)